MWNALPQLIHEQGSLNLTSRCLWGHCQLLFMIRGKYSGLEFTWKIVVGELVGVGVDVAVNVPITRRGDALLSGILNAFSMSDKYPDFLTLAAAEPAQAYAILVRDTGGPLAVAAPHGGGIEPGTSEIALAIAGGDFSYYQFEGKKSDGNHDLHITSARFDEPRCLGLLRSARLVLTVHGEDSPEPVVYLGGGYTAAFAAVHGALEPHGFIVREHANRQLQGVQSANICNLGRLGAGLQLELSLGLRRTFFQSLTHAGRKQPRPRLAEFGRLVRHALLQMVL